MRALLLPPVLVLVVGLLLSGTEGRRREKAGAGRRRQVGLVGTAGTASRDHCNAEIPCEDEDHVCRTTPHGNICYDKTMAQCEKDSDCAPEVKCWKPNGAEMGYCGGCTEDGDCKAKEAPICFKAKPFHMYGRCVACHSDTDCDQATQFCHMPRRMDPLFITARAEAKTAKNERRKQAAQDRRQERRQNRRQERRQNRREDETAADGEETAPANGRRRGPQNRRRPGGRKQAVDEEQETAAQGRRGGRGNRRQENANREKRRAGNFGAAGKRPSFRCEVKKPSGEACKRGPECDSGTCSGAGRKRGKVCQ